MVDGLEASCYFCGERATSRDHVVPNCLFPRTSNARRIKVPVCDAHNNSLAEDEEYFRAVLLSGIWDPSPAVQELIETKLLTSFQKGNSRLRRTLLLTMKDVYLPTSNGFASSGLLKMDATRMDRVAEKIVRGMNFHVTKRTMPRGTKMTFYWSPKASLIEEAMKGSLVNLDPEIFTCRYRM